VLRSGGQRSILKLDLIHSGDSSALEGTAAVRRGMQRCPVLTHSGSGWAASFAETRIILAARARGLFARFRLLIETAASATLRPAASVEAPAKS